MSARMWVAAGLVGLVVAVMAASQDDQRGPGVERACGQFREVVADARDGVLTDGELRSELQDIRDTSLGTGSPEMVDASTAMLAGVTAGDEAAFLDAVSAMGDVCRDQGV